MSSNTLKPDYLQLINSILAVCYVHLHFLARFIEEENNKYFYTQDQVREAVSIEKVINHRVEYIMKKKKRFMKSGKVESIACLTPNFFRNPSTGNKISSRNPFAFTFIEHDKVLDMDEMIDYYRELERLVEHHKLPISQPQAKKLLHEIREYLEYSFEYDQPPDYLQKNQQNNSQKFEQDNFQEFEQDNFQKFEQDNSQKFEQDNSQKFEQDNSQKFEQENFQEFEQDNSQKFEQENFQEFEQDNFAQEFEQDNSQEFEQDNFAQEFEQDNSQKFEQENFAQELKDSFKHQPQDYLEDYSQDFLEVVEQEQPGNHSEEVEDDKQSDEDYLIEQQMLQRIQLAKDYKQNHFQIIQEKEQEKQRLEEEIKRIEQSSKNQLKQAYQEYEKNLQNLIKDHEQQQKLQEVFALVTSQDIKLRETNKNKNHEGGIPPPSSSSSSSSSSEAPSEVTVSTSDGSCSLQDMVSLLADRVGFTEEQLEMIRLMKEEKKTKETPTTKEPSKKNNEGSLPFHLEAKEIGPPPLKLSYSVFECDNNGGEDTSGIFTDNSYQYLGEFVVSSTSDCGKNCGRACDGCLTKAINICKEQPDTLIPLPQTNTPPVHDRKPWRKRDVMKSVWQKSILPFKRNKEPDNRKTRKRDVPKRLWERITKKTNNQ
ncbi:hypothetical protein MOUN0_C02344 [Monosporozyma unispora]